MNGLLLSMLLATQVAVPGAPRGINDISQRSYCLETGTCPPPNDGFPRPAPGFMFLAVGLVALGAAIWRADHSSRSAPPPKDS